MGIRSHAAAAALVLPLLFSATSFAQSILKEELKLPTEKKWGIAATLSSASSLHKDTDDNRTAQSRLTIAPNIRLSDRLKATASISGVQEMNGGKKSSLSNTRLSLSHAPIVVSERLLWFPTVFTDAPTDAEGRKRNTFRGNMAAQATGIYSFKAFDHAFSAIPSARFTRNFHRLTRNADDSANIQQTALTSLAIETGVAKNLSFNVGGSYIYGWTYQTSTREQFSFSQEFSYEVDRILTVSAGHSNDADVFAADGQSNNVRLFNENTSAFYLSLRAVY